MLVGWSKTRPRRLVRGYYWLSFIWLVTNEGGEKGNVSGIFINGLDLGVDQVNYFYKSLNGLN